MTKNLRWEIVTKKHSQFKRWDGVKDEKFYYGGSLKNPIFREFHEKPKGGLGKLQV